MKLFGTDGIRGKVNGRRINPETALRVGLAVAKKIKSRHDRKRVIIGKDTRISGYMIESALASGLLSMGVDVTLVGPVPTPGVAYLTRALRQDAGIVISASHNQFDDNGIKIFSADGFKLPDDFESEIEELINSESIFKNRASGAGLGRASRMEDATGRYIEYVKSTIPKRATLDGIKVVVDCANGAAYKVTPAVLTELGAEVVVINNKPNGLNINENCGSLHLDSLVKEVKKHEAHIGIAHDGDADRTLICDEKGNLVDGDGIMGIWAVKLKQDGKLAGDTVVATVMSNLGLEVYLKRHDIKLLRAKVGDRYVVEQMRKGGYNLGGEQSGHIIFLDYNTTGDGPITALRVLHLMQVTGKPLSELVGKIERYPQILINVPVAKRRGWHSHEEIKLAIEESEAAMGDKGRVLVRPSGTEKLIRVMVEGQSKKKIQRVGDHIAEAIRSKMS